MTIIDKLNKKKESLEKELQEVNYTLEQLDDTVLKHINLVTDKSPNKPSKTQVEKVSNDKNPITALRDKLQTSSE